MYEVKNKYTFQINRKACNFLQASTNPFIEIEKDEINPKSPEPEAFSSVH